MSKSGSVKSKARKAPAANAADLAGALKKAVTRHCGMARPFQRWRKLPQVTAILQADQALQVEFVRYTCERLAALAQSVRGVETSRAWALSQLWGRPGFPWCESVMTRQLLRRPLPFAERELRFIADRLAEVEVIDRMTVQFVLELVKQIERCAAAQGVSQDLSKSLHRMAGALGGNPVERKLCWRLRALAGGQTQ